MSVLAEAPVKCPKCGREYELDDLEFVGVRKRDATADLFCPGCTRTTRVTRDAWIKARASAREAQKRKGDQQ
jgi:NMD protein affecting ribosome stability and mRNA decay